jgi:transcriptional regulator with XRE-family HTH domain
MSSRRNIRRLPPRHSPQKRAENRSLWVDEPLQLMIRNELDRRDWSISDLGRAIGSQPSLISRWMQGQRPNPVSLDRIANVLALDVVKMMQLAGHLPPTPTAQEESVTITPLLLTLRHIEEAGHLNGERVLMLRTLLDWMLDTAPLVMAPPRRSTGQTENPAPDTPPRGLPRSA